MSSDNSNIEYDIKKDKYHLLSKKINSLVDKLDFQHLQWLLQGNFIINEDSIVSIFESKNHEPLKDISIGNDDEIYKDSIISNISKKDIVGEPIDISKFKDNDNPIIHFIEFYVGLSGNSNNNVKEKSDIELNKNIDENRKENILFSKNNGVIGKKEKALEILTLLLQYTSDLNFETNQGQIPLFLAFYENQVDILKLFFQYFLIPKTSNPTSNKQTISKVPLNLNLYNEEWDNVLLYTFKHKNELPEPAFSFLLLYGMTHCYEHGHILGSTHIDLNAQSWNGKTLVMAVVERNNYSFLKTFFETVESIHEKALLQILYRRKNNYYRDLLHQYHSFQSNSNLLLDTQTNDTINTIKDRIMQDVYQLIRSDPQRIDLEVKDRSQNTALLKATWSGNKAIARCLLRHGANPRVRDIYDNTHLMIASLLGRLELVKLFIAYGAEINARRGVTDSDQGQTALGLAIENHHEAVVQYLKKHQAIE